MRDFPYTWVRVCICYRVKLKRYTDLEEIGYTYLQLYLWIIHVQLFDIPTGFQLDKEHLCKNSCLNKKRYICFTVGETK